MNEYVKMLANGSRTESHELIEECLEYYGVDGVKELTEEQVKEFCRIKGLLSKEIHEV